MIILELLRLEESSEGTFGILKAEKAIFCYVLEPPDRLNEQNISCIPTGQYYCLPYESPRHGKTFIVADVPERSGILFHAGNVIEHTEGCLLLGDTIGKLRGERAVLNSGTTFKLFMACFGHEGRLHLTISNHF